MISPLLRSASKAWRQSVRVRIAAWNTLAVAVVAVMALLAVRQMVRWTLLHEIDQVLAEDGREVGLVVAQLSGAGLEAIADELQRKADGHEQHRWFVRLLDAAHDVVWATDEAPPIDDSLLRAGPPQPMTLATQRVLAVPLATNSLGIENVQLGSSIELFDAAMSRIDQRALMVLLGMLALAPLIGYFLAGVATRRLEVITLTAAMLRPSEMSERLPERGWRDEFDRLAGTVNHLLDRIAAFLEEKRNFLDDVAHELRTPMAAIHSSVEVALSEDRTAREYRELLEQILEDSQSLEILVNQVLLLSEATASSDEQRRERVDIAAVVARSCEMFAGVADNRDISVERRLAPSAFVLGNRRHLAQVANNLIDNALKYTPPRGSVSVVVEHEGVDIVRLVVHDNGSGIAREDVPRIFDRFFRADRARRRDDTHGTGLGLSICQTIVTAHGGTIECRSELGRGAQFTVRLPASIAATKDSSAKSDGST